MKTLLRRMFVHSSLWTAIVLCSPAAAQLPIRKVPAPEAMKEEIRLPGGKAPRTTMREEWLDVAGTTALRGVTAPTLIPVLPRPGTANGTALIIAPGGGFLLLSMESEGFEVARYLADQGITVFVLKYRLQQTPDEPSAFLKDFLGWIGKTKDSTFFKSYLATAVKPATEDAKSAMRWVRGHAGTYGIDPGRVGFMGFSAGAFTTLDLVYTADAATLPDFVAPIYAAYDAPDHALPAKLPPMWGAIATNDEFFGASGFGLIEAWKKRGSVEFKVYDSGGHGFGFAGKPGTTTTHWPQEFMWWLQARKLVPMEK
jgi:dienelactone hydrolase